MNKKLIGAVLSCAMVLGTTCFASPESDALDKEQAVIVRLLKDINGDATINMNNHFASFSNELKEDLTHAKGIEMQKQVKEKYGAMKSIDLKAYERLDGFNRVMYLANFEKVKPIFIVAAFDNNQKMLTFAFITPQKENNTASKQKGRKR